MGKDFLNKTLEAQSVNAKIDRRDHMKLRRFCTKWRDDRTEKIFSKYAPDKGLSFRICKELKKFNTKTTSNQVKKGHKT